MYLEKKWAGRIHVGEEVTIARMNLNKNKILSATPKYAKKHFIQVYRDAVQVTIPHVQSYFHNFTEREDRKQARLSELYTCIEKEK